MENDSGAACVTRVLEEGAAFAASGGRLHNCLYVLAIDDKACAGFTEARRALRKAGRPVKLSFGENPPSALCASENGDADAQIGSTGLVVKRADPSLVERMESMRQKDTDGQALGGRVVVDVKNNDVRIMSLSEGSGSEAD